MFLAMRSDSSAVVGVVCAGCVQKAVVRVLTVLITPVFVMICVANIENNRSTCVGITRQ